MAAFLMLCFTLCLYTDGMHMAALDYFYVPLYLHIAGGVAIGIALGAGWFIASMNRLAVLLRVIAILMWGITAMAIVPYCLRQGGVYGQAKYPEIGREGSPTIYDSPEQRQWYRILAIAIITMLILSLIPPSCFRRNRYIFLVLFLLSLSPLACLIVSSIKPIIDIVQGISFYGISDLGFCFSNDILPLILYYTFFACLPASFLFSYIHYMKGHSHSRRLVF